LNNSYKFATTWEFTSNYMLVKETNNDSTNRN